MTTNTKKEIARSSIIIRKENELKKLKEKKKKIHTQLKSNKTRLQNLKTQIEEIHRRIQAGVVDKYQRCAVIREEIVGILKKVKRSKAKRFSTIDKMQAEMLYNNIIEEDLNSNFDNENPEFDFQEDANGHDNDEEQHGKSFSQMFEQFQEKPDNEEHRKIRKIFLSLANRCHPDKARDQHEEEVFHNIMQRLNAAYKRGDIAELFEIKRLLEESDAPNLFGNKANFIEEETVEHLQREIDQTNIEIEFLNSQLSRTKKEIRRLDNSDFGQTLKTEKQAQKYGGDTVDAMETDLDEYYDTISALRDEIQNFYKTGNWSKEFKQEIFANTDEEMPFLFQEGAEDDEFLKHLIFNGFSDEDDDDIFNSDIDNDDIDFMQTLLEQVFLNDDIMDFDDDIREFSNKDLNSNKKTKKKKKKSATHNQRRKRKKTNKR